MLKKISTRDKQFKNKTREILQFISSNFEPCYKVVRGNLTRINSGTQF